MASSTIDILKCAVCGFCLESPMLLPCGESICKVHIKSDTKEIFCNTCQKNHLISGGLYPNKAIEKFLERKIQQLNFGETHNKATKNCQEIEELLNKANFTNFDAKYQLDQASSDFRKRILEKSDELKAKIDEEANKLLQEVHLYKKECETDLDKKDNFNGSSESSNLKALVDDVRKNLKEWQGDLSMLVINQERWAEIEKCSEKVLDTLKSDIEKAKRDCEWKHPDHLEKKFALFCNLFNKNPTSSPSHAASNNIITKMLVDNKENKENIKEIKESKQEKGSLCSKIIEPKYQTEFLNLCEIPTTQEWRLLYRASEDGFGALNFHHTCDQKAKTLTILRSENGNIFGGYTEAQWDQSKLYRRDKEAFVYSFRNQEKTPLKIKIAEGIENNAIFGNRNNGPVFGNDIAICDHPNKSKLSYSYLGSSYRHPSFDFGSAKANSFLAGSFKFLISEIEVFQKI